MMKRVMTDSLFFLQKWFKETLLDSLQGMMHKDVEDFDFVMNL